MGAQAEEQAVLWCSEEGTIFLGRPIKESFLYSFHFTNRKKGKKRRKVGRQKGW